MNIGLSKPVSLQDFLAWEGRQELRYEFDGVQPVAMTSGTVAHAVIQGNLAIAVGGRLRGKPCRFYGMGLKVEVAGRIRYPDGFVVCTELRATETVVRAPVVIFEILSNHDTGQSSTASIDRITKSREYSAIPSVQRYVMLEQDEVGATEFTRSGEDWVGHVFAEDAVLLMPEIGIEVPLTEFYVGIELDVATSDLPVTNTNRPHE